MTITRVVSATNLIAPLYSCSTSLISNNLNESRLNMDSFIRGCCKFLFMIFLVKQFLEAYLKFFHFRVDCFKLSIQIRRSLCFCCSLRGERHRDQSSFFLIRSGNKNSKMYVRFLLPPQEPAILFCV